MTRQWPARPGGLFAEAPLAEREREYSPSSCIGGNYRPFIEAYGRRSAEARREALALGGRWSRHRCGTAASAALPALELCLPAAASASRPAPLLMFVHGGYWQELAAADSLFAAAGCLQRGIAFAALDYSLAPAISVAGIVQQCHAALGWLGSAASALGIAAERVIIAGSSAGAHLCAAMCTSAGTDTPQVTAPARQATAPPKGTATPVAPRAAVLVSGIYWLEPLIGTSIDAALRLDVAAATAVSPGLAALDGFPPSLMCWGDNETAAFKAQSRAFAARLAAAGRPCEAFEVAGRNHFDVVLDLADPGTALGSKVLALFG